MPSSCHSFFLVNAVCVGPRSCTFKEWSQQPSRPNMKLTVSFLLLQTSAFQAPRSRLALTVPSRFFFAQAHTPVLDNMGETRAYFKFCLRPLPTITYLRADCCVSMPLVRTEPPFAVLYL